MTKIKLFVATKAFIEYKSKILILKESGQYSDGTNQGKFDVPGGRIEPGQNFKESLIREIKEETNLYPKIERPFYTGEWRPVVRSEQWQIVGTFFICQATTDQVKLSADHEEFLWIKPSEYQKYDLIENLEPAFEAYLKLKK